MGRAAAYIERDPDSGFYVGIVPGIQEIEVEECQSCGSLTLERWNECSLRMDSSMCARRQATLFTRAIARHDHVHGGTRLESEYRHDQPE